MKLNCSLLLALAMLLLLNISSSVQEDSGRQAGGTASPPQNMQNMKWIQLGYDDYKIQVPGDFKVHKRGISRWPEYAFERWKPTLQRFDVTLTPYFDELYAPSCDDGDASCGSFEITGQRRVYFRGESDDLSDECTMNSTCTVPADARYSFTYSFVIPDKSHNTLIEFRAADAARSASSKVDGPQGIGLLLRETIIPSLTPLH